MPKAIVVGGGPAGMMAAAAAAQNGWQTLLLEQNEKLGKKLFITGKGRCNLTNIASQEEFFESIPHNAKFLYSAFSAFTNADIIALVERMGVPTKVERGGRVFPASDKSSDVIFALARYVKESGAEVLLKTRVLKIETAEGRVTGAVTTAGRFPCECLVLATGGATYPKTGSTGDGYAFAQSLGHTVTPCCPGLVPLVTAERWPAELAGLTLKNVRLTVENGKKKIFSEMGEMLFTHFGVSGPLVLTASSLLRYDRPTRLFIDLKPALSVEQLDARVLRDFGENTRRQCQNALGALLPSRLIPVVIAQSGLDPEKPVHSVSRAERAALVAALKGLELHVAGHRPMEEGIVTRGGVSVREVNPSTMESKLISGLYFAGELLDVDGFTGGFNLQIAYSTGVLAGSSIARRPR